MLLYTLPIFFTAALTTIVTVIFLFLVSCLIFFITCPPIALSFRFMFSLPTLFVITVCLCRTFLLGFRRFVIRVILNFLCHTTFGTIIFLWSLLFHFLVPPSLLTPTMSIRNL